MIATTAQAGDVGNECRVRLAARPEESVVLTLARAPADWGFAVLVAVRDIREQVRLERQVAQATKMQAVGQLAGGIAHDFNNILTAVLGLCDQLLARHTEGSADFDDIDQIRQNGNRAANLVRQLLAFARQQTLRPQVLEIGAIIDGLVPLLHRLLGPSVKLILKHGDDLGAVRVDPGQLEQVIVNLAVNARDAMDSNGTLVIESCAIAASKVPSLGHDIMPVVDHIAIVVSDTGSGIPPEIAAKIFEPFFTTKPIGQGTGLGLSTVYGIVKQTGGFIFASARPEGG
ncbi:MAG: sensor histidine kinase, partial [Janthinobacterium lividum]